MIQALKSLLVKRPVEQTVDGILASFAKQQADLRFLGQQLRDGAERKLADAKQLQAEAESAISEAERASRVVAKLTALLS